ncbi:MAG: aminopeptidase P family protein, partial [Salibacteraceae bacterium]|nr:aminopeptidase P family protein [Salibacteraceae bacterium]
MNQTLQNLIAAEQKAAQLFSEIEARGMISAGKTEKELNTDVYDLALEMFGISKYWHKRIVRAGKNT